MIKVLIVDDIPETRDHLTKLLSFEQEVDVCGTAESGEEAIKAAMDLRPDVIVMDMDWHITSAPEVKTGWGNQIWTGYTWDKKL